MRRYQRPNLKRVYRQPYTAEQIEYIYDAAVNGVPMQAITKKLKTTHDSIRSATHRQGLSIKHIRDTYTLTRRQLSEALAVPWRGLDFLLTHHGIKPYKKHQSSLAEPH